MQGQSKLTGRNYGLYRVLGATRSYLTGHSLLTTNFIMHFNISYLIFGITLAAYAAPVTNDVSSNPISRPASVVTRAPGFYAKQHAQYIYTANGKDRRDGQEPANPKVNAAVEKALESFGVTFELEALNDFAGLKTMDQEIPFEVISDVDSSTTGLRCPCKGTVRILRETGKLFVTGKLTSIRIKTYKGPLDVTKDVREKMIAEEALNTKTIRVPFPYTPA
ncbi:hypothetical protein C8J55DRAFT_558246 [Lentinula edodes]|uniref:Uncharacterized protein n=1 Tax=Lentinula lateritia TaxID=40482 RepID=A0A9W9DUT9_9AGAR|nr:hypothetical protein C8J55DRAFT_558246 [Lentinula edodes]